jgi:hypothetical protein
MPVIRLENNMRCLQWLFTSNGVSCSDSHFLFKLPLLYQFIFALQTASVLPVHIFRFRLRFIYMTVGKAVYMYLFFTKVLYFIFLSLCHFLYFTRNSVFMRKRLRSQKAHICPTKKAILCICFHETLMLCRNIVYFNPKHRLIFSRKGVF